MLSDIRVLVFHKNKKNFLKRCTVVMCHQHGMSWKKRRLVCNKSLYLVFNFIHHRVCEMCSTRVQIQQMAAVQITKFDIHFIHFMLFDCLLPMHIDVCGQNGVCLNGSCAQLWLHAQIHVIMWLRGNYISLQMQ